MLNLDPAALAEEINRAEEFRRRHTERNQDIGRRLVGNWYRTDHTATATPENTVFAYVAYMLPELWYANPSCRVTDNGMPDAKDAADAMEEGLRTWEKEVPFTREGQLAVRDALMGYGVIQVGLEPRDWPGDRVHGDDAIASALRPFAIRLSPEQLILDPIAESVDKARFIGHSYYIDLADVQADADSGAGKFDPEAVKLLNEVTENAWQEQQERPFPRPNMPDRHRAQLIDLWIPEHNRLLTLARTNSTASLILRDVEYWGPPEGPYEVFGFYDAPGDPYPLSPLAPIMEQLEELWIHQRAASSEAESYKRFVIAEAANQELQKALMTTKSGQVATVAGFTGQFAEVQLGGSPEGRLAHIQTMRDRADRTIGLSDAQRGRVQGKTATETDIVQGNVDTRTSYMRQKIAYHTTRVLKRVGWYLFSDPAVAMPVRKMDPATQTDMRGVFLGGPQAGQEHLSHADFHYDIEPTSMQHSDDAVLQQRAMETLQMAQTVGQVMPMMPNVNWKFAVNMFGESFNQKNLFDLLFVPPQPSPMMPPGVGAPGAMGPGDPMAAAMGGGGAPGGMPGGGAQWSPNGGMPPDASGGAVPPFAPRGAAMPPPPGGPAPMQAGGPRGLPVAPMRGGGPMLAGGPRRMPPAVKRGAAPMMKGGAPRKKGGLPFMFIGKSGGPRSDKKGTKTLPTLTGGGPRAAKKAA